MEEFLKTILCVLIMAIVLIYWMWINFGGLIVAAVIGITGILLLGRSKVKKIL